MRDSPSISRRQALAAAGASAIGLGGYAAGIRTAESVPDWLAGRDCDPAALATSETDWSFPRHDRANTAHAPARAGPDWPIERVWEREWPVPDLYRLPGLVVANGVVVVVAAADPEDLVAAFSLTDGWLLWRRAVDDAYYGQMFAAGGTAFVEADVPGRDRHFAARSLGDGETLWSDSFDSHTPQTLAGGRLVTTDRDPNRRREDDHFAVTAYDARTGVECWRTVLDGWAFDAAVVDGRVIFPTRDAGVVAVDPATGVEQWRSEEGADSAAIAGGHVVTERFAGTLRAFSLEDGSVEWAVESEYYQPGGENDEGEHFAPPSFELGAVTPETVFYELEVHSDYPSRLQARDAASGELLWDVGPDPEPVEYHGYSRPVLVGDDVLAVRYARAEGAPDPGDALLRLDHETGEERDRLPFDSEIRVLDVVVAGGYLLVATRDRLLAFA